MTMTVVTHYMRTHFKEGWDIRRSVERWFTVNSEFSLLLPISTLQRPSQFCYVFIITVVVEDIVVVVTRETLPRHMDRTGQRE